MDIKWNLEGLQIEGVRVIQDGIPEISEDTLKYDAAAGVLDRADRFAALLISPFAYEKTEGSEYGIEYDREIHNDTVLLEHQQRAAERFLRERRGFGLLADPVGSGKTFEAGAVLSELGERGLLTSLLVIAPNKVSGGEEEADVPVLDEWVRVLELKFGLGKGTMQRVESAADLRRVRFKQSGTRRESGEYFREPEKPLIMTPEVFAQWHIENDMLFAVVVVDEVHEFFRAKKAKEGGDERAMQNLSRIMHIKRGAQKPYCLLLSATPHAGNLADMFPLWYFVRNYGGSPEDYGRSDGQLSALPQQQREYYTETVCRGAKTVMEFVVKQYIELLRGGRAEFVRAFRAYLNGIDWENPPKGVNKRKAESLLAVAEEARCDRAMRDDGLRDLRDSIFEAFFQDDDASGGMAHFPTEEDVADAKAYIIRYWDEMENPEWKAWRDEFASFLASPKEYVARAHMSSAITPKENECQSFDYLSEEGKYAVIGQFLRCAQTVDAKVRPEIAARYRRGVLAPVMIRQQGVKHGRKKRVVDYFFVREGKGCQLPMEKADIELTYAKRKVRFRFDPDDPDCINEEDAFCPIVNGKPVSAQYPLLRFANEAKEGVELAEDLYSGLFMEIVTKLGATFRMGEATGFYDEQIKSTLAGGGTNNWRNAVDFSLVPVRQGEDVFARKIETLKYVLRKHKNERVIVFFDYDRNATARGWNTIESVKDKLKKEFGKRLEQKGKLLDWFNATEDAVLLAENENITVGANLQACCVVVNFEVSPDPMKIQQSIGRVFRFGQRNDVTIYSFADMDDLEGYVLAYFTRIGLMADENGDAEILAGCNSDGMTILQCPHCRSLRYYSNKAYERMRKAEEAGVVQSEIRCTAEKICVGQDKNGTLMKRIGERSYTCSRCRATYTRSFETGREGYLCYHSSIAERSLLECVSPEKGLYTCSLLCTMKHCSRFTSGDMAGKCAVLALEAEGKTEPDRLIDACAACKHRKECGKCAYLPKEDSTEIRAVCDLEAGKCKVDRSVSSCAYATQRFVLDTDSDLLLCPNPQCAAHRQGIPSLVPSGESKTFADYIRKAYDQAMEFKKASKGEQFCSDFRSEIEKVDAVYRILQTQDTGGNE